MKKTLLILILTISICSCTKLFGESSRVLDSLWNEFKKAKQDATRIKLYLEIGDVYEGENFDTALFYYNRALLTAQSANVPRFEANALKYIGLLYGNSSEYTKAQDYYKRALSIYVRINYKKGISACYNNIGLIYYDRGDYAIASEYFTKSLKIDEQINDKKGMSYALANLGSVSRYQGKYSEAIDYFQKALKLREEYGDKFGIASCYSNIGIVHRYQDNYALSGEYYAKALAIYQELKNSGEESYTVKKGMADTYNNLGIVYGGQKKYADAIENFKESMNIRKGIEDINGLSSVYTNLGLVYKDIGDYEKARNYYLKSFEIKEKRNDKQGMAVVLSVLSEIEIISGNYSSALEYSEKSLLFAKETGSLHDENYSYYYLSVIYEKLKNYAKSLEYFKMYKSTADTMFNKEKAGMIADMETRYQTEKKQIQIEKLEKDKTLQTEIISRKNAENNKQKILIFFTIGVLLLIIIFSVILLRLFLLKRKANVILANKNAEIQQKNEEITAQRDEIEAQRDLLAEQKKEITDSINYALRIQTAVLPNMDSLAGIEALPIERETMRQCESENVNRHTFTPSRFHTFDYFVLFKPKDVVSGDFYWGTRINEWLIITVADCTGHGVPGAFMSMLGVSFLNEIVRKKEIIKASEILDHLRESIIEALQQKGALKEQKDGMDIALCAINTCRDAINGVSTGTLQFAGANNPLYVIASASEVIPRACRRAISQNTTTASEADFARRQIASTASRNDEFRLFEVKADKQPISIYEKMEPFTNHEMQLQKGDTLYLCSDGYEDQFGGPNHKKFKSKQLKELFVTITGKPMDEQRNILDATFENWKGDNEQTDDVTILSIKI